MLCNTNKDVFLLKCLIFYGIDFVYVTYYGENSEIFI